MTSRRGSILVAVLLIASLLAIFVGVAADRLHVADAATRSAAEDIAADTAVRGAVELLYARASGRFADLPPISAVDYPGLHLEIVARDEAARVDLNLAHPDLLAGIFRAVGVDAQSARVYARVIVDRRADPAARSDPRKPRLTPPLGPFEHVRELDRLPQIPANVLRAVEPFVTVTSLGGRVAPLVAPAEVIAALPGMDPGRVEAFLAERRDWASRFDTLMRRYGIVADHVSKDGSNAVRLSITLRIGSHRVRGYEVVVAALPGDDEPFRFLSWNGNALAAGTAGPRG